MRFAVVAASLAAVFVAAPASAVDFGALFGAGGANHKECAWSRPHIVFENNARETKSLPLRRPNGELITTVTVAPGKEEKVIFLETDVVHLNQDTDFVFGECDDNGHYPAYRFTWKKDGSAEYHPRSK